LLSQTHFQTHTPDPIKDHPMKKSLLIATAFVSCTLLGACGGGADSGVEVRPPVAESDKATDPTAGMQEAVGSN